MKQHTTTWRPSGARAKAKCLDCGWTLEMNSVSDETVARLNQLRHDHSEYWWTEEIGRAFPDLEGEVEGGILSMDVGGNDWAEFEANDDDTFSLFIRDYDRTMGLNSEYELGVFQTVGGAVKALQDWIAEEADRAGEEVVAELHEQLDILRDRIVDLAEQYATETSGSERHQLTTQLEDAVEHYREARDKLSGNQ